MVKLPTHFGKKKVRKKMSSEKQLILIILVWGVIAIYQMIKDYKEKKHDEKLQRHLSKYFNSKW